MKRKAFRAAFPCTIPIFAGFWFLGMAYGLYMNASGFSFLYPLAMGFLIYGGSLEFIAVKMLLAPFAPISVLAASLLVQARHLFYGISMLDKFRGMGWKKFYLIYGMCDETFSVNYSAEIPEDVDRGWFYFFVTLLNQLYWVSGAIIGAIAGSLLSIHTEGISFVMTAMFAVIFMEQWMKEENHSSAWIGLAISAACLAVFGPDSFLVPSMIGILLCLLARRSSRKEKTYSESRKDVRDQDRKQETGLAEEEI